MKFKIFSFVVLIFASASLCHGAVMPSRKKPGRPAAGTAPGKKDGFDVKIDTNITSNLDLLNNYEIVRNMDLFDKYEVISRSAAR